MPGVRSRALFSKNLYYSSQEFFLNQNDAEFDFSMIFNNKQKMKGEP